MKPTIIRVLMHTCLIAGVLAFNACGGATGTQSTTSSTSTVSGTVASSSSSASADFSVTDYAVSGCFADTVVATDSDLATTSATVDGNCQFELSLTLNKSYSIAFLLEDQFVANLVFDSGNQMGMTSSLRLGQSAVTLELGQITVTGNSAIPQTNPLSLIDCDDDGLFDYDDSDDDGDGVEDEAEEDCDLDGHLDDDDDDCLVNADQKIIRVKPSDSKTDVDLNKDVKVYTRCPLDLTEFSSDQYQVVAADGSVVDCSYKYSYYDHHAKLECEHAANFAADTEYTVTVTGLVCSTGESIPEVSFSFTTEIEDDDVGDAEDDSDDELSEVEDDDVEEADDDV